MTYNNYSIDWSIPTLILYLIIVVLSYLFPKIKYRISFIWFKKKRSYPLGLLLVQIMLIFIKGFSTCGTDLVHGYYLDFLSASSIDSFRDKGVEIGFIVLNVIIKYLIDQYWFFLLVVAVITIVPVFIVIYRFSKNINVSIASMLYTSIFFFPGISLIRISIAATIVILSYCSIIEDKKLKALFYLLLATSFHTSAAIVFLAYLVVYFKKIDKKIIAILFVGLFSILYINKNSLTYMLVGRYSVYSLSNEGFGVEQLVYYLPLIFILVYSSKHYLQHEKRELFVNYVFLLTSMFIGMSMYIFPAFGRCYILFTPIILVISNCLNKIRRSSKFRYKLCVFLMVVYCFFRFYMYISQYYSADGIMPYNNIFGWRF